MANTSATTRTGRGQYRRYTKRQKADAVIDAENTSVAAAAEKHRVPESSLRSWYESPLFVELRAKTAQERADQWSVVGQEAIGELRTRIPTMENRDLIVLGGVAADKERLLSGHATSRTENVSITDGLDDHEKDALHEAIVGELARRSDESPADPAVGTAGPKGAETPGG